MLYHQELENIILKIRDLKKHFFSVVLLHYPTDGAIFAKVEGQYLL